MLTILHRFARRLRRAGHLSRRKVLDILGHGNLFYAAVRARPNSPAHNYCLSRGEDEGKEVGMVEEERLGSHCHSSVRMCVAKRAEIL